MKVDRGIYIGGYRMAHCVLGLHFDSYIENLGQTYVVTNISEHHYRETFPKYDLDWNKFTYVNDQELFDAYPEILHWDMPGDYRGTWLRQQALKIASLDYFNYDDAFMIQDPDTFCIQPYCPVSDDGVPNYFILPGETHGTAYYEAIVNSLGIERQTKHSFVSEFMPFLREDWQTMRELLETRNNKHFLDAIIDNCPREQDERQLIWFSEYELLANYVMTQREIKMTEQKRFAVRDVKNLDGLNSVDWNCYVDACPNLDDSILFNFSSNTVKDFEEILLDIKSRI
jgi:hypothetical protein